MLDKIRSVQLYLHYKERASLFTCLLRRHFELILLLMDLMDFHTFSFSVADSIEKRLNTSTFSAWSFVTSSHCLLWAPSVLLLLFQGEERQKFKAHRCLSSSFSKTSRTPFDLLGVTNDRMTSSPNLSSSRIDDWSAGVRADLDPLRFGPPLPVQIRQRKWNPLRGFGPPNRTEWKHHPQRSRRNGWYFTFQCVLKYAFNSKYAYRRCIRTGS